MTQYSNSLLRTSTKRYHLLEWLWFVIAIPVYGIPAYIGIQILQFSHAQLGNIGLIIAIPLSIYVALFLVCVFAGLLTYILPQIEEGNHRLGANSSAVTVWLLHYGIGNYLRLPNLLPLLHANPLIRRSFYYLRGAKIHPSSRISYDVKILDPSLLEVGEGSKIGAFTMIGGHYSDENNFVFGKTSIGKNVLIGAYVKLGPNTIINDGAVIQAASILLPGTIVGANEIWGGAPARLRRERISLLQSEKEIQNVTSL